MLFNSLEFLLFFPIVTILYFILPHKYRWLHLLVASCIFYMAFIPVYIFILFFTIIIDYIAGIIIENAQGEKRKLYLLISIVANVGVLCVFKYYNFFIENFNSLFSLSNINYSLPYLNIILPIGLSFHTFQAMSYTIEVYRGNQKAEKHFGIYTLYVMFYPQLVAGPIERPQNLLYQFKTPHSFNYDLAVSGLKLMLWGMFKKVVIADNLAQYVNTVYEQPENFSGFPLVIATLFFSVQIYCDFSGYSDIAIGSARVMGFKLMNNFNIPYYAKSIAEFWKRWHISLSTWFKDYLYIPLGGNRVTVARHYYNLFFVFLVSGLWHGANWTYIVWGALHGFYLVMGGVTQNYKFKINKFIGSAQFPKIFSLINIFIVFCLVSFAWIFFRANNIKDAIYIVTHLFSESSSNIKGIPLKGWSSIKEFLPQSKLIYLFFIIGILEFVQYYQYRGKLNSFLSKLPISIRWSIYYILIALLIINGQTAKQQFIYFQF